MWNVLIVEPSPIYRAGLRRVLESELDFNLAGEADSAAGARSLAMTSPPDIITIEAGMDGQSVSAVAGELLRLAPAARILVLTSRMDKALVAEALEAGVRGYAGKDESIPAVLRALRLVSAGQTYLEPGIAGYVMDQYVRMTRKELTGPLLVLTARERAVFDLTVRGATGIGETLGISARTVDTHRARLMRKLGVHSTPDLVRLAARLGLLNDRAAQGPLPVSPADLRVLSA